MIHNDAPFLIDVSRLLWRRWTGVRATGIDRVCLAYLEHFGDRAQAVVQNRYLRRVLNRRQSEQLFAQLLGATGPTQRLRMMVQGLQKAGASLAQLSGDRRPYLNIGHTGLDQPGFVEWARRINIRPVHFIHDLIPITHPEYCRAGEQAKHTARMLAALESAAGVIGNSRATLADLNAFAIEQDRDIPPSIAAWLGVNPMPVPLPAAPQATPRPYFITLGTIEARKHHLFLLQMWSRLVSRYGDAAPDLKVIGRRGWECEQVVDLLDRSPAIRGHVREYNDCDDDTLAGFFAGARALLFPSLAEGFGLPIIEALDARLPVIASDIAIFREIGRGVIDLVDPLDGPAWMLAIRDYAQPDSERRTKQLRRMDDVRAPTWADHFARVEDWLSEL
jgi:glycosyltransferase involved in cell wall biosynthesis